MAQVSVTAYDFKGFQVTIFSDPDVPIKGTDKIAKTTAQLINEARKIGLSPEPDPEKRGLEWQYITNFVLRKRDDKYEVDLFTRWLKMKVVTLYTGDEGVLEKFYEKSGISSLDEYKVYPAPSYDRESQGDESEFFHKLPKTFPVCVQPKGTYKEGKAKGKQKMKAVL